MIWTILYVLQDTTYNHGGDDPTAVLLRGAECNVCMNRPVQVWQLNFIINTWSLSMWQHIILLQHNVATW